MILAAWDYVNFRKRTGHYSRVTGTDLMCGAYEEHLPAEVILALQQHDLILIANFSSWMSWLIMYFTSSQVSHCAVYLGNGKILHATLGGGEVAPIETLYGSGIRLLACKAPIPPDRRRKMDLRDLDSLIQDRPYSIPLVLLKGLYILAGRDVPCFRWKFFVDIASLILAMDASIFLAFGQPPRLYLVVVAYLGLIFVNRLRWPPAPSSLFRRIRGKPSDLLQWVVRGGGAVLPDPMSPWARHTGLGPGSPWSAKVFRRRTDYRRDLSQSAG